MREAWWTFEDLEARADEFDAVVARTPDIDTFCSSSEWILPAREGFLPGALPLIRWSDEGSIALCWEHAPGGLRWARPLEAVWGLASPLVGPDPRPLAEAAVALLFSAPVRRLDAIVLCGLAIDGAAETAVRAAASARARTVAEPGPEMARVVASLDGGLDGFWSRRSAKFRANARRARRAAEKHGITYEHVVDLADPDALTRTWRRILAVESRSRKAEMGGGLAVPEMRTFYERMLPRLARRGALRVVFARRDGRDLAFVFGGVVAGVYRGLQVSFDDEFAAESPGVLVHLEMIERLVAEGVSGYDLGSDMEYKRRWGEVGLTTRTWLLVRR